MRTFLFALHRNIAVMLVRAVRGACGGVRAAFVRRAHPFNGFCVQPCSRWDMIIDICTLQAMKGNIFEYSCMYLQYISLCKKAGKAYCENEK